MIERSPTTVPATWEAPAGIYALSPASVDSWDVSLRGQKVATLVDLSDEGDPRWTIRVTDNEVAGVGSSWATWEEALADLAEFRADIAN